MKEERTALYNQNTTHNEQQLRLIQRWFKDITVESPVLRYSSPSWNMKKIVFEGSGFALRVNVRERWSQTQMEKSTTPFCDILQHTGEHRCHQHSFSPLKPLPPLSLPSFPINPFRQTALLMKLQSSSAEIISSTSGIHSSIQPKKDT